MKPRQRLLPARENILSALPQAGSPAHLAAVDLLLHLTCAADVAREEVYRPLQDDIGLSEGKFSLLMTLRGAGGEMSVGMLAQCLGVSDATVSIMVSRMLKESRPLVRRTVSTLDRRAVTVAITDEGESVLESVLPRHQHTILRFAGALTLSEQLLLVGLLKKLIEQPSQES